MPLILPARRGARSSLRPTACLLFFGAVLAQGRRTVTTEIRGAELSDQFQSCSIAVDAAGKRADCIGRCLLTEVVRSLLAGAARVPLALDDTPTKRHGPHAQGAGVHHNPTPVPTRAYAKADFLKLAKALG